MVEEPLFDTYATYELYVTGAEYIVSWRKIIHLETVTELLKVSWALLFQELCQVGSSVCALASHALVLMMILRVAWVPWW
jgi:hypothetical protein